MFLFDILHMMVWTIYVISNLQFACFLQIEFVKLSKILGEAMVFLLLKQIDFQAVFEQIRLGDYHLKERIGRRIY